MSSLNFSNQNDALSQRKQLLSLLFERKGVTRANFRRHTALDYLRFLQDYMSEDQRVEFNSLLEAYGKFDEKIIFGISRCDVK